MLLPDVNLFLYAYDSNSAHHAASARWIEKAFSGREQVRLAWTVILAFLRLTTSPRLLAHPYSLPAAIGLVSEWLSRPNVGTLEPGERHWEILSALLPSSQATGPLVMDAHLAALAIEHGATLFTADRDFTRFQGLKVEFPLG